MNLPEAPVDEIVEYTSEELLSFQVEYLRAMSDLAEWIDDIWLDKDAATEEKVSFVYDKLVEHYLLSYVTSKTWKLIRPFSKDDEHMRKDRSAFRLGTSLQGACFLEICRLGSYYASVMGDAEAMKKLTPHSLPALANYGVVLTTAPTYHKPVLSFTQMELEESLRVLLFRWQLVDFHEELRLYVEALSFRMFQLISCLHDERTLDAVEFRLEIKTFNEYYVRSLEKTGTMEGYYDLSKHKNESPVPRRCFKYNASWFYKCQVRFFFLFNKLRFFTERTVLGNPNDIPPLESNFSMAWMKNWITWRIQLSHAALREEVAEEYISKLVPPGDTEWLAYAFYNAGSKNASRILEVHHKKYHSMLTKEASTKPDAIVTQKLPSCIGMHDWIVLIMIHKYLINEHIQFLDKYVVRHQDAMAKLDTLLRKPGPLLVQFFSRFLVFYHKRVYYDEDIYAAFERWYTLTDKKLKEKLKRIFSVARREFEAKR